MPYYESVFIARQDVSASAAEALADKFADLLKTNGGAVAKREYWGLRPLAYRIKKNKKGHYFLFNMDASPQAVQEMERNMRLDEDILRYLTLRIDEIDETPSIMMQNRGRRDEETGGHRSSTSARHSPKAETTAPDKPAGKASETSDKKGSNAVESAGKASEASDKKGSNAVESAGKASEASDKKGSNAVESAGKASESASKNDSATDKAGTQKESGEDAQ